MLREYFPNTMEGASLYGGILKSKNVFYKNYVMKGTFTEVITEINEFLVKNGYNPVLTDETDDSGIFYKHPVSIAQPDHLNQVSLWIEKDNTALPQTEFLINVLKKFKILLQKIRHNADKYPVHKSKGNADKYTEL